MTITEMLEQSGLLTLLGIGVVFGFIIILMCAMKLLHFFVHITKLDSKSAPEATANGSAQVSKDDGAVVAAIAAAIKTKEGK